MRHRKHTKDPAYDPNGTFPVPFMEVPSCRTALAIKNGVQNNILFVVGCGLGDRVCAEPVMRWAIRTMTDCEFSICTESPELFTHLNVKRIYDHRIEKPDWSKYYVFCTLYHPSHFQYEFVNHAVSHQVDAISLNMFRCQIPNKDKEIQLPILSPGMFKFERPWVCVHAGKHWPSKTFPKWWWDQVITQLYHDGIQAILIGSGPDKTPGTVDVNPLACVDLRDKLTIPQSVSLLYHSDVLLSNDSAPIHMAAAGKCHIEFLATIKHQDHLYHWRNGQLGWRMTNHSKGGVFDLFHICPNRDIEINLEECSEEQMLKFLPDPKDFARSALNKRR
jgi:hypothetical protein